MRVAINGWFWGRPDTGSGQYTHRLLEHLAAAEPALEATLVSPAGRGFRAVHAPFHSPHEATTPASNLGKVWFEQVAFPRACRRLSVDLAHVPYWAPPLAPPVPTVTTIHDLIPLLLREYRGGPLQRAYTALVATAAQSAALVLTDSQASRQDILAHLDLPAERVHAIPLAADRRYHPDPLPDDEEVRRGYGLPERYVLYLGSFDRRKNVATALQTYTWVGPTAGRECPLVLAGRLPERDSSFAPDPRRQAQALGLRAEWVRFVGSVREEHKPAVYRGAVAFIYPSRYEGFGLPALEAMACGTPVVGSSATSIPEVVGDSGVLLDPDDASGMAGAILQLIQDPPFRSELSQRALVQSARFSWQRTARETVAAYRQASALQR